MNPRTLPALFSVLAIGAVMAQAAVIDKLDNADALNLTTSWDGGVVPGAGDIARWPLLPTQNMATSLGDDLAFAGIVVTNETGSTLWDNYTITINGSETLTLGSGGIYYGGKKNLTVNSPVSLAADQTWTSSGGGILIPAGNVSLNGFTLTTAGGNDKQAKGQFLGEGHIVAAGGKLRLSNGSSAPDADFTAQRNAGVVFEEVPARNGNLRFRSVALDGADHYDGAYVYSKGRKNEDGHDRIGPLSAIRGNGLVTVEPNSAKHQTLEAASLTVSPVGFLHLRGTDLGTTPVADLVPYTASILFGTAPTLLGGGGARGTVTQSILPAVIASPTTSGGGVSFATYDSTYGVRMLDPDTEFSQTLPAGQNTLQNVRLVKNDTTGTIQTLLPDGLTAVNALMLDVGGATGTGGYILDAQDGATSTLRVNSGMVYVRNTMPTSATAGDEIPLQNFTLDLNGHGGMFISMQSGNNNMQAKALEIRCPLVNDGGEGVNFCAVQNRGFTYLYGTTANTYTGPTRLLSGAFKLMKANNVQNVCIPGDLEIYGGTCQNTGNTIPDTADIRIYGGTLMQKGGASNSGSGAPETYNRLTMYGGSYTMGASGTSSGSTTIETAVLHGGSLGQTRGHSFTIHGPFVLAGGTNVVNRWEKSSNRTLAYYQGGLSITNTPTGAYQPMHFDAGSSETAPGAKSTLSVGITFTGNATNDNTAVIAAVAPGEGIDWAQFLLNGDIAFNIGDGAADIDLRVEPQLVDNGATAGSLRKTGAGTLALVNPANAHSGGTSVQAGTLVADGALAGDVSVANGATFQAGSLGDSGSVAVGGDLALADGARLRVRHEGTATTLGVVAGDVVSAGKTYVAVEGADDTTLKSGIKFMEADSFAGTFVCTNPKVSVVKRNKGTELWLRANDGVVILVR